MQFILEEESGTYILAGVLCFTINVDCSTSFLSLKGENTAYFTIKCRLLDRRDKKA